MIRSRALLAAATLALTAGLCACGKSGNPAKTEIQAPKPSPSASLTQDRRETIFLDATAQHLCAVQSQVYTDPSAMASAYASRPVYTDLTAAQVDAFQQQVISDPAFADRLTRRIQATCGTAR
ncbi:hypothetical protein ACQP2P_11845 [Dactylosporangium sp. CA-139114]|uniref:hypothetical protein n=1 Tax=Dactylosporangium sp. CA-139114 TaxID=3239931 RepID=UPI003D962D31